ncbi:MAG: hypothetical protein ABIP55_15265 [Tepidisphaeraceae bacterium]
MRSSVAMLVALLVGVMPMGCQAPRAGRALPSELAGSDPDRQLDYWQAMADQPIASNDEAFHGLLLYVDGADESADYPARVAALRARRMIPASFDEPAESAITRGVLGVAIMKLLDQKGGVTMQVLGRVSGPCPRYATRELVFLNVYPPSTPNQVLTGGEFVGIIGRVEDFQRGNAAGVPAVVPAELNAPPAATQPVRSF